MDYDKKYEIRLATMNDIDGIMAFIDQEWRQGHILSRDRELFCYEHVDGPAVHFLLAIDREHGSIEGLLGFIPASKDRDRLDIWTGIWKVRDGVLPLLGMELYRRLQPVTGARAVLGVGDSPRTTGRLLKKLTKTFNTWRMRQYYLLSDRERFRLAEIAAKPRQAAAEPDLDSFDRELHDIHAVAEHLDLGAQTGVPYKDQWYLAHRYFQHPVYQYRVFGLKLEESRALLVLRVQECSGASVIRIVDYLGDQVCFRGVFPLAKRLLEESGGEYMDFYVHGFQEQYILDAGFSERTEDDVNIIPNYFSPFEQKNVEIWVSGNIECGLFCKADGDQDRPN